MQTDVTTKYHFFPFSEKSEKSLLYLDVRSIQDNYTMEESLVTVNLVCAVIAGYTK